MGMGLRVEEKRKMRSGMWDVGTEYISCKSLSSLRSCSLPSIFTRVVAVLSIRTLNVSITFSNLIH
jgi:hypothetical protein